VVEKLGGRSRVAGSRSGNTTSSSICQMPNNVSATAFSMAASAGGAVKAVKTTPLMDIDEGMEAMRKLRSGLSAPKRLAELPGRETHGRRAFSGASWVDGSGARRR